MSYIVREIRRIVGNEDGSGGEPGTIEFEGELQERFIRALELSPDYGVYLRGGKTRIQRGLGWVELWINGFYVEGSGVRKITARALQGL
jgi:hypothetical protein